MNVNILANISSDITISQNNNITIAKFTVKERKSRVRDENKKNNFWNVTVFGKEAEKAGKYFKNGSPVFITGKADMDEYTDKNGQNQRAVNISAVSVDFVPKDFSGQNAQNPAPAANPAPAPAAPAQEESASDELPF